MSIYTLKLCYDLQFIVSLFMHSKCSVSFVLQAGDWIDWPYAIILLSGPLTSTEN